MTYAELAADLTSAEAVLTATDRAVEGWISRQPFQMIHEHDQKTGWHELSLGFVPDPPPDFAEGVGEFAKRIKDTLDAAVVELVKANGGVAGAETASSSILTAACRQGNASVVPRPPEWPITLGWPG